MFAQWPPLNPSTGVDSYYLNVSLGAASVATLTVQANLSTQSTQVSGYIGLSGTALRSVLTVQLWGHNSAGYSQTVAAVTATANSGINGGLVQGVTGTVGFYETVTGSARVELFFETPTSGTTLIYRNL